MNIDELWVRILTEDVPVALIQVGGAVRTLKLDSRGRSRLEMLEAGDQHDHLVGIYDSRILKEDLATDISWAKARGGTR